MLDATPEERDWVKAQVLRGVSSSALPKFGWEFDGPDYLMLLDETSLIRFHVGRNGNLPSADHAMSSDCLLRYPWLKRDDFSFNVLTRDALVSIFSHLKDAWDLYHCLRVSRLFRNAASAPSLYGARLQRLMERCSLTELPFSSDTQFAPHQHYFAMLFFSCKTDRELEAKIMAHIHAGNDALAWYIRNKVSGWGHSPLPLGSTIVRREKHLAIVYPSGIAEVLVDADALYAYSYPRVAKIISVTNGNANFNDFMWKE
jgi:F-box-like